MCPWSVPQFDGQRFDIQMWAGVVGHIKPRLASTFDSGVQHLNRRVEETFGVVCVLEQLVRKLVGEDVLSLLPAVSPSASVKNGGA